MHINKFAISLGVWVLSALATPAAIVNKETLVNVRIEGADKTHFEGFILTRGHNITTSLGGNHHCDGTNNNTNPHRGPTPNAALDDVSKKAKFSFDGAFFPEFDDFLISSIAGESNTATQFWTILLNFQFIPVGGCQQQVKTLDKILFAFDGFAKAHVLELSGPTPLIAHANHPVVLTVIDGLTGTPVQGADVHGQTSDANGKVSVTFVKTGVNGVKAEKSDSVRSNQLDFLVI